MSGGLGLNCHATLSQKLGSLTIILARQRYADRHSRLGGPLEGVVDHGEM